MAYLRTKNRTSQEAKVKKRKPTIKKALLIGITIFAAFISLTALAGYVFYKNTLKGFTVVSNAPSPTPQDTRNFIQKSFEDKTPVGILLLGYGGPGHDGAYLTDTMQLAYIEPAYQTISLIAIPRDTWVELPVSPSAKITKKINEAYSIGKDDKQYKEKELKYTGKAGGGTMAKDIVTAVTGLPAQRFIAVDFKSFVAVINKLGGIKVNVEKRFEDPQYPLEGKEDDTCDHPPEELPLLTKAVATSEAAIREVFPCRFETVVFEKGLQTMTGEEALKYARSRHSKEDGNDFGRSLRQKNVMLGIKDKVYSLNFIPKIPSLLSELKNGVETDLSSAEIESLLFLSGELKDYTIVSLPLTTDNVFKHGVAKTGQYILTPKAGEFQWPSIHAYLKNELERIHTPSPTSTPSGKSP